jgi:hypothetical protein
VDRFVRIGSSSGARRRILTDFAQLFFRERR